MFLTAVSAERHLGFELLPFLYVPLYSTCSIYILTLGIYGLTEYLALNKVFLGNDCPTNLIQRIFEEI